MSFSKRPFTSVAEKRYAERKKEISKNELESVKEKIVTNNNKNYKNNNNHERCSVGKASMIPRPKIDKNMKKDVSNIRGNSYDTFASNATHVKTKNECKKQNKIAKKGDTSDSELDAKMYNLIAKVQKERSCEKLHPNKLKKENRAKSSSTIKMMSAPLLNINKNEDFIKKFENEVEQISSILLNTSTDLSNTLKNCASLSPQALEKKNRKIQLAMKRVKSLTLLKTKNFLEEAKQLVATRELLRNEIQNVINSGKKKLLENESKVEQQFALKKKIDMTGLQSCDCDKPQNSKIGATGDSTKLQNDDLKTEAKKVNYNIILNKTEKSEEEKEKNDSFASSEEIQNSEVAEKEPEVKEDFSSKIYSEENLSKVVELLTEKLERKTETITHLNCKLFELHQAFEENALKYNDLQIKLTELCKNVQWNYILWKEIGKLKNQIKILEQNNKDLQEEKKELELNIKKLNEEIISLTKLNHLFSQQFCYNTSEKLLEFCTCGIKESIMDNAQATSKMLQGIEENVLEEKRKVINQLLSIIRMMSDQENIAHKHKAEFLAKLELQKPPK